NGIKWWHYDPTKWLIKSLSWLGLTKDLRTSPQERIESARLQMQLLRTKNKVTNLANADEILEKIHMEYELMKQHLLDYYQAKKTLLEAKRQQLADQQLRQQVEELKIRLLAQQKHWQNLTARYG
ncbi:MAG: acyl-CoA desaturase, partial [Shewanella sp.]